jgi:hypothetical protein
MESKNLIHDRDRDSERERERERESEIESLHLDLSFTDFNKTGSNGGAHAKCSRKNLIHFYRIVTMLHHIQHHSLH